VLLTRSEASSYIEPFKGVLPLAELFRPDVEGTTCIESSTQGEKGH